ncbi:MAG: hypothetical protein EXS10_03570 [Phycisphaerales bacterium]|nr:hypothetical protein [Phycisphaerales bacterium]
MTAAGGRCPECGERKTTVARTDVQVLSQEANAARERLEDGWRLWSRTLFATPLILFALFGACSGPVLLVAFAFIAPFRFFALKRMTAGDPYVQHLQSMESDLARCRFLASIECGLAIVVVVVAILQSMSVPVLPHTAYLGIAVLYAVWQCITLLQAHQLARSTPPLLVEVSRLPRTSSGWIYIPCGVSMSLYLLAGAFIAAATFTQDDFWFALAWLMWFFAALSLCIAAVWSRAHAMLVCDCLFEAQLFQSRMRCGTFFYPTEDPSIVRHATTPKQPEDDAPIPLADG